MILYFPGGKTSIRDQRVPRPGARIALWPWKNSRSAPPRENAIFAISPNASQEDPCRRGAPFCRGREVPKSSICFYSCSRLRSFRNRLFAKVEKGSVLLCNSEAAHKILNGATPKWGSRLPCDTGTPAPSRGWWPRPRLPRAPRRAAGPDPGYLAPPDAPPAPTPATLRPPTCRRPRPRLQ